jgi:predicted Zn-dependent peptidase
MRQRILWLLVVILALTLAISGGTGKSLRVPVEYHRLDNGLKVVLSPDHTAPIVIVAVYYNIGFRLEPRNRTGFAHLFEHMMFQGSTNLEKGEFLRLIQGQGGALNGSTRFDFTNYYEIVPSHKLETALWAEADRMKGLDVSQENLKNQQGVVINEVKANVLNQPYGGFPWLDVPQYANENWCNAHNFYGDLTDLEAATLENVRNFYKAYYAPNNAALVISGDFAPAEVLAMVKKHFGGIEPPAKLESPDFSEPRQEKEKIFSKDDPLAAKPAMALAYHMPERLSPEYFALGLLDQVLLQGKDSLLYRVLVTQEGLTGDLDGGINSVLGDMFNYNGPMLWTASLFYDDPAASEKIISAFDSVIEEVRTKPLSQQALDRALVKIRSRLYDTIGDFGRADLLACYALFDDNPGIINSLEEKFRAVTPELILKTAQEYLRPSNRTILTIKPKKAA